MQIEQQVEANEQAPIMGETAQAETQEYQDQTSGQPDAQEEEFTEEAVDGVDEETEPSGEVEEETEEATTEDEYQEQEFKRLTDFAEALDTDIDALMDEIETTVKVNGQEIPVTLKELHSGYQKDADYRQKTSEVAEARRQLESVANGLNQRYSERLQEVEALTEALEASFVEDYNSIDWAKLRTEDPANYAALQQDMEIKKQHMMNAKLKVSQQREDQQQEFQQYIRTQVIPGEFQKLRQANPEWANQEKWNSDYTRLLGNLVENYGFAPEEVAKVYDSRLLRVAFDALNYQESKKARKEGVEEVKQEIKTRKKTLKKVLKPGANQPRVSGKAKALQAKQSQFKKSGSVEDAAAVFLERMKQR